MYCVPDDEADVSDTTEGTNTALLGQNREPVGILTPIHPTSYTLPPQLSTKVCTDPHSNIVLESETIY